MEGPAQKRRRLSPESEARTNVLGFATWDLEGDYEQRMRKKNKKKEKSDKLMIKTAQGIEENPRMIEVEQGEGEDADIFLASGDEDGDSAVADLESSTKPQLPRLPPTEEIRQAKEDLARLAGSVSENPEEHIGHLGGIAEIAKSANITVQKLALATQLAVYKDIIPGYRIRPLSKDDAQAKVSKEVKKLRSFEQGLLSGYKEYVQELGRIASRKPKDSAEKNSDNGLISVAIACACTLLTSVPHFNCRNDLIAILVRKLSSRGLDGDFIKCREAIEELFRDDEDGHASLEIVSQLTKIMRTKNYNVHESVLNMFLQLRLLGEFVHKASTNSIDKQQDNDDARPVLKKKQREFRTKRERKMMKERKQVEKEMKEADATVSYEERDKNQSETLKLVFVAYFRILKARTRHLMGAVLEGLAKYSHLINQDFFGDILEVLKDLMNEAEASLEPDEEEDDEVDEQAQEVQRNVTRETLLCTITAFALLQGQYDVVKAASSLHLDLSFFITRLYRILIPLVGDLDIELGAKVAHLADPNGLHVPQAKDTKVNVATTTVLLLRSLQSVLLPPTNTKAVPPSRIAAFVKQLETLALHMPQKSAIAILELVKQVTKTHGNRISALWYTEERKGDGVFDALSQEIESSNPFATTIWEGELLRHHFDPKIRDAISGIEKNVKAARA